MALKVGELFASFNLDTSGIDSAVSSAERSLNNIGSGLENAGSSWTSSVTKSVGRAASAVFEAGTEFEAQMSRVYAIGQLEGDTDAMDAVRAAAIEMGSTTVFSATEAAEAMEYMALAGWSSEEMIAGLPAILNLAAASGENLGSVSDIVTDALTAFGLTADDAAHFADVLAQTSANSNTNVAMLGEAFKYVGPLAGSLGYSVEDVTAALGLMANAGIKGSMAGTSLRNIIMHMIDPTEDQAAAMEALGVSFYNADGTVKSFGEIMRDLRSAGSGYDFGEITRQVGELDEQLANGSITQEEYDAAVEALVDGSDEFLWAIMQLGGARGLSGLLAIINASEEDFNQLTGAINQADGAAEQMASTMLDNAQGSITLFKSAVEGLEITLWGLVDGSFRDVIDKATEWVDAFRQMDSETQMGTLRIAGLAAAIGPAMMGMGKLIQWAPTLAKSFQIIASPAGMLAVGLLAIGAAAIDVDNTIGKTLEKALPSVGKKIADLGKKAKRNSTQLNINTNRFLASLRKSIAEGLPDMMDGIGDLLAVAIETLGNSMPMVGEVARTLIQTLASGISRNLPQLVPAIVNLIKNLAIEVVRNAPVVLGAFLDIFTSLATSLADVDWTTTGAEIGEALRESFGQIKDTLKQLFMGDAYTEDASWYDVGYALIQNLKDGMKTAFGSVKNFVGSMILGDDYDPDESWGEFGIKIVDKVFDTADSAMDAASGFVQGIIEGIGEIFTPENIAAASETIQGIVQRILTRAADLIANLGTFAADILEAIGNVLFSTNEEGDSVVSAGVTALTGILQTIFTTISTKIIPGLGTFVGEILTAIGNVLFATDESGNTVVSAGVTALTDILRTIFDTISTQIIPGMGALVGQILTAIGNLFTQDNAQALGDTLSGLAVTIITGITDAIVAIVDALTGIVEDTDESGIVSSASTIFERLATGIMDALAYAIPRLGEAVPRLLTAIAGLFSAENLQTAFDAVGRVADHAESSGLMDAIFTALSNILTAVMENLGSLVAFGGEFVRMVIELLAKIFSADNITAAFDSINSLVTDAVDGATEESGLLDIILSAVDGILSAIGDLLSAENIGAVITGLTTLISNILNGIVTLISSGQLTDIIVRIVQAIADLFKPENVENVITGVRSLISSILTAITDLISSGALGEALSGIISAIGSALSGSDDAEGEISYSSWADVGVAILDALVSGFESGGGFIKRLLLGMNKEEWDRKIEELGEAPSWTDVGNHIWSTLETAFEGHDLIGTLLDNATDLSAGLLNFVGRLVGALSDWLANPDNAEAFSTFVSNLVTGIANSLATIVDTISTLLSGDEGEAFIHNIAGAVTTILTAVIRAMPSILSAVAGVLTEIITNPDFKNALHELLVAFGDVLKEILGDPTFWSTLADAFCDLVGMAFTQILPALLTGIWHAIRGDTLEEVLASPVVTVTADERQRDFGSPTVDNDLYADLNELFGFGHSSSGTTTAPNFLNAFGIERVGDNTAAGIENLIAFTETLKEYGDGVYTAGLQALRTLGNYIKTHPNMSAEDMNLLYLDVLRDVLGAEGDEIDMNDYIGFSYEDAIRSIIAKMVSYDEEHPGHYETRIEELRDFITSAESAAAEGVPGMVSAGLSYSQGIARGIRSGAIDVNRAVGDVADGAVRTLGNRLRIGSPSRITAEIGGFFSQGFADGILNNASAAEAALTLGQGAADALQSGYDEIMNEATNDLSMPVRDRASAEEAQAEQNRASAIEGARIIANALNGARVVMDGEITGHLLVPYISEEIATSAAGRRYGTE